MLNCAVVGCGKIGVSYDSPKGNSIRTHFKAYIDNKNCKLVAACDPDTRRLEELSDKWGSFKTYSSLDRLLKENSIDVLSICSPTEKHFENFDLACKAGVKKIWLEKPSAENSNLLKKMIQIKDKFDVEVFVNYFRRYDPCFIELKKELVNIGNLSNISGFYTKGLRNNASHLIDLLLWLIGPVENQKLTSISKEEHSLPLHLIWSFVINANIKALDHRNFELFELDIIGHQAELLSRSQAEESISLKHLSLMNTRDIGINASKSLECNTNNFMKNGLDLFLRSKPLPSLEDDLSVQKIVDSLFNDAS